MLERRAVILVVLIVVAALSWWWSQDDRRPNGPAPADVEDSDYSFTGFVASEMGPQGALAHTLSADQVTHYPDRDISVLSNPRLDFYEGPNRTWDIAARNGLVNEEDRTVLLSGEVHVAYAGTAPGAGFDLYTEELRVWPDIRRAESEKAVKIVQEAGVIDSVGLRAELDSRQLYLLSQVRGTYAP